MIEINDSTTLLVAIFSVAISVLALAWQPLSHWLNGGRLAVRWSLFVWSPLTRTIHEWPVEAPLHPGESDLAGDFPGGLFFDGAQVTVTNRGRVPVSVSPPQFSIEVPSAGLRRWRRVQLVSPRPAPREVAARIADESFENRRVDAFAASSFLVSLREVRHRAQDQLKNHECVRIRVGIEILATGKYVTCPRDMVMVIRDRAQLGFGASDRPTRAQIAWRAVFDHAYFRRQLGPQGTSLLLEAVKVVDLKLGSDGDGTEFAEKVARFMQQRGLSSGLAGEIASELARALDADTVLVSTALYPLIVDARR